MENVIEVSKLSHSYGQQRALNELSFTVQRGEVFGLLGPNGAGKTTTVRLLNGMFQPSAGVLDVMGIDPSTAGEKVRTLSGVLTETPALYERLSARQNLRFFGVLAGMPDADVRNRSDELLEVFGLSERANERTGTFSKGMKQRLALARAWLTRPKLLFLDEPTSGLDPEAAVQVRELIEQVRRQEGATVFLCTHNLDEAQRLCDRLLIMRRGSALAIGDLNELRRLVSPGMWLQVDFWQPFSDAQAVCGGIEGVFQIQAKSETEILFEIASEEVIPQVIGRLSAAGAQLLRVQPREISLEQVYLQLQNNEKQHQKGGELYELA